MKKKLLKAAVAVMIAACVLPMLLVGVYVICAMLDEQGPPSPVYLKTELGIARDSTGKTIRFA